MSLMQEVRHERSGLTRKQAQLLAFIRKYYFEHRYAPSFQEMMEAMELRSKSGIHRLIQGLVVRGRVTMRAHSSRSVEPVFDDGLCLQLPEEIEGELLSRVYATGHSLEHVAIAAIRDGLFPRAA